METKTQIIYRHTKTEQKHANMNVKTNIGV